MTRILSWIDDRTGVRAFTRAALFEHIPGGGRWRYVWGSTLTFAFVVQLVTGFVLWMNYSPSSTTAWESVYYIQNVMPAGDWLRGVHHFTAQAMIVLLALHMMQVVIDGAYRAPREFNWWIGLALLLLTFGLGLTGYLLPWDQRGYWSTKVATNIMTTVPLAGPAVQRLAIGGTEYGHHTLTRFFALHAGLLPLLMIGLIGLHVYVFRRHGLTVKLPKRGRDSYFWVDQVLKDAVACLAVLATVLFLVAWPKLTGKGHYGAELSAPADPSVPFSAARPEWYFLSLFQGLKYFPGHREVIGAVVIPGGVLFVFVLMPFIGRARVGHWFNVFFTLAVLTGAVVLTAMAVIQDAGRPQWKAPFVGDFGYGFGVAGTAAVVVAILLLFGLILRRGTARGYVRLMVAVGVVLVGMVLLVVWALPRGAQSPDAPARLGTQAWQVGGFVVQPEWQRWLLFGLLGLAALLLTAGLLREPYSMPEAEAAAAAGGAGGFSHRWQWVHRARLGLLVLLVFGAAGLTAVTVIDTPAGDATYQRGVADARRTAERVVVLAGSPDGIPPTGAAALLRSDAKTQGPRLFARHCASCHTYNDPAIPPPADGPSAPDLTGFASREWIAGMLDPKQVDSVKYFGPKMEAHDGKMVEFVKDDVANAETADKADLQNIIVALSAEAQLAVQQAADARDAAAIEKGRKAMSVPAFECAKCHDWYDKKATKPGRSRGPDLTGYGSRAWTMAFIRNPAHPRFYGDRNDRMPLYGEKKILDDEAIGLIVDWMRGDWYEPGRPPAPSQPAAVATATPAAGTSQNPPDKAGTSTPATKPAEPEPATAPAASPPATNTTRPPEPPTPVPAPPEPPGPPEKPSPTTVPTTAPAIPSTEPATPAPEKPAPEKPAPEKPAPENTTPAPAPPETPDAPGKPAPEPPPAPDEKAREKVDAGPAGPVATPGGRSPILLTAAPAAPRPPATAPATRPAAGPATPAGKVDFVSLVKPILETRCVKCHGPVRPTNGYRIYTKALAFKPGDSEEPPLVAGSRRASNLFQLVASKDDEHRMPQKGPPLAAEQVALIGRWIDEGAAWPDGVELDTTASKEPAPEKR